ncbi:MAG: sporulation protein YqfD [Eubacterium sp.]
MLFGFVEFRFSGGFYENFINECFDKSKDVKDIALCEGGFTAWCSIPVYKSLHRIALRHGGTVKIIRKRGLPFLLKPLRNRSGFFIGAVVFIFLLSFLEGFIWNIEIIGNERISDATIMSYVESGRLKTGAMWGGVDRSQLEWDMMSELEDIAWVHINRIGTTARIEINETTEKPEDANESRLKGEKVFRKELEAVAYRQQSKISIKEKKKYKRLIFFFADIPLYLKIQAGDITETETKMLTVKEKQLPVGTFTQTETYLTSTPYDLTDSQLKALAEKKLSFLEEKELDGYEIINKSPKFNIDGNKCTVTCAYVVREKEK